MHPSFNPHYDHSVRYCPGSYESINLLFLVSKSTMYPIVVEEAFNF